MWPLYHNSVKHSQKGGDLALRSETLSYYCLRQKKKKKGRGKPASFLNSVGVGTVVSWWPHGRSGPTWSSGAYLCSLLLETCVVGCTPGLKEQLAGALSGWGMKSSANHATFW